MKLSQEDLAKQNNDLVIKEIKQFSTDLFEYIIVSMFRKTIRNIEIDYSEINYNVISYKITYSDLSIKTGKLTLLFCTDNLICDDVIKEILIHER